MSEVAMWETAVGSIFAVMILLSVCREIARNHRLGQPMGPTRRVVTFVAALAALYGALHTFRPEQTAVAPVAATEAAAPVAAPVESTPIAAPTPPVVVAAVPEAKAPSILNPSATSSTHQHHHKRHRR